MKILVIDDDEEILELMMMYFKSEGHECFCTVTADGGIEIIKNKNPDIVFLDIMMPEKDGITALKEIHEIDKNLPVVMVTAYRHADAVVESFRLGALDCLLKPINFDYLKNNILARIPPRNLEMNHG